MVTYRFIVKIILKYLPVLILISANSISARQFAPISSADAGKMLNELDKQLSLRKNYLENRVKRIDSIKYQLTIPRLPVTKQLELTWKLARLYEGYLSDSAVIYFRRGQNTAALYNHNEWEIKFKIKKCETMPLVALFNEAIAEYSTIHIDSLNGRLKILALDSGRQLYSYVASFYSDNPEAYRIWIEKSMYFQEQLIKHTDPNTPINTYNRAEYLFMTGKYRQAGILFHSLLNNRHPLEPYMAARINHKLSKIAAFNSNHNEEIYYLAKSAIADIKSATLEIVSLQDLGQQLYTHGDLKRAYSYLAIALDNSVKCHAVMRMLQTSQALPVIQQAHSETINKSQKRLYTAVITMAALVIILITITLLFRIELIKKKRLEKHLRKANVIKEMYMSLFLHLSTIYMNKLNQFCKIASRKISTGRVDELYQMTRSGRFVEDQIQEFYTTFDQAFLHIYPTFPSDVNNLLKPEEKITLTNNELLNTDLRILAFIRLGVEESPRIAQALNYSVHTIYSYRNRLKNRAINRDTFEQDILNIGKS